MKTAKITRRWHWREYKISQKSTPREIAKIWVCMEVFRYKKLIDDLCEETGGSGCWWNGVNYGDCGGPGLGKMTAYVTTESGESKKGGPFSMRQLYKEILEERRNPRLFKI